VRDDLKPRIGDSAEKYEPGGTTNGSAYVPVEHIQSLALSPRRDANLSSLLSERIEANLFSLTGVRWAARLRLHGRFLS
jgi:hypothetical protein